MSEQLLSVGSIVHYVLPDGRSQGQHRPAIVVRDWTNAGTSYPDGTVNLQVFTDGANDGFKDVHVFHLKNDERHEFHTTPDTLWRTSIHHSETKEPGTWHWPE